MLIQMIEAVAAASYDEVLQRRSGVSGNRVSQWTDLRT